MMRSERWLALVLRVNGVLMLLALPAALMPTQWMDAIHQALGMGTLPRGPIVEYLARTESALYAVIGAATLLIASDLKRFRPLIWLWGVASLCLGLALLVIDWLIGMPTLWLLVEGPYLILLAILILSLLRVSADSMREPTS